jgi:hypothetical protein
MEVFSELFRFITTGKINVELSDYMMTDNGSGFSPRVTKKVTDYLIIYKLKKGDIRILSLFFLPILLKHI